MPWGSWLNDLPTEVFMVVHLAAFALGAGFAWLAFKRELDVLGVAFSRWPAERASRPGSTPQARTAMPARCTSRTWTAR